ncbi:putative peptidase (DUF1758) domain-containing protein [Ditylenchus destructor]|nr:putative peptidase (DUF1758) domain-containing protein [Ditylenchus destructor]
MQKSTSTVEVSVDQTLSNSAVSDWKQEVFLMAKEATIASPIRRTEVQAMVFFDNGSQLSYITKALAKKLKLRKIRDSELEVHTFNQDSPMRMKSAVYAVHIQQNDGSMREVIVHSTDRISASFRTALWKGDENQQPRNIDALIPKDGKLWEMFKDQMSEDIKLKHRDYTDEMLYETALFLIYKQLLENDKDIDRDFPSMPKINLEDVENMRENYDKSKEEAKAENMSRKMNKEQKEVFETIAEGTRVMRRAFGAFMV